MMKKNYKEMTKPERQAEYAAVKAEFEGAKALHLELNMARGKPLIGRVTYANGDAQEFTDAEAFLKCVREELPYRPTTGFRYEVLTDDPAVCRQVDDMIFDFYGEEAPCRQEDHEPRPEQGMTFGGM